MQLKRVYRQEIVNFAQKSVLIFVFSLFISSGATAQQKKSSLVPLSKMILKQWTAEDGLVSNNLTSIYQSKDGFIWITSFSGVFRFDGKTFKRFDKENIDSLRTNGFLSLTEDPDEGLIFASQGSGAFLYDKGKVNLIKDLGVKSIRKVHVDRTGKRWYGTTNQGLVTQDGDKIVKVDFEGFNEVSILDIFEDKRKNIWFGTGGSGLIRYRDGVFKKFDTSNLLRDDNVAQIIEVSKDKLLLGSPSGLYLLNLQDSTTSLVDNFENIDVNDLMIDVHDMIWVATEQGLFRINIKTGYQELFNERNGLPGNKISGLIKDHEGNVWLSMRKDGLIRLTTGTVTMLDNRDGILNTKVNIIQEFEDQTFFGCDDGSVFVKKDDVITPLELLTKRNEIGVRDFEMMDDGTLLIGSYLGLIQYKNGKERLVATTDGLSHGMIRRIVKSEDGSLWLATRDAGVTHFRGEGDMDFYNTQNGLKSNYLLSLEKDKNGRIVAGTHSGGISIITKDTVTSYLIPNASSALIFNIHIDQSNGYWVCTNMGVFYFKEGVFKKVVFEESLKIETFFDFVQDSAGGVWLTSNHGITRSDMKEMEDFIKGEVKEVHAEVFDHSDGMTTKECTAATRSLVTAKGELWVPTIDGVAIIDPQLKRENKIVPEISVNSFVIDGEIMPFGTKSIEPGKIRYLFEFSSTSYQAPDKVEFKYRLSGVDKEWVHTRQRKIEYTNLYPGTYTFMVKGSNNTGVWNEKGDKISFIVKPFFYQTWWFYTLLGLMAALIIYMAWVWRVRRIKAMNQKLSKLNEELDRFVYSASHDMRAPLASMLGLVNLAKISQSPETKDQCFDMIEKSVGKLDEFIKDIIDYSRNQRTAVIEQDIDLKKELTNIIEDLRFLNEEGNVSCEVNVTTHVIKTDLRRFGVVMRNLIANAFLYHDNSKTGQYVEISCSATSDSVKIIVEDNGLGMDPKIQKNIFKMFYRGHEDSQGSGLGLYIAKENIDKLDGSISVTSKLGEGTTFTVILPNIQS